MNRRACRKAGLFGAALAATPASTQSDEDASGPRSDPARYPEVFGDRCVISWRPVSTIVATKHLDEEAQRKQLREGLAKLRGCHVEVFMHEPMAVHHEIKRIAKWAEIAIQEAERAAT